MYDEFGIYGFTSISVLSNPTGSGAPGSTIYLSSDSQVIVQSNREYYVTANVTDLRNATGGETIPRSNIEVQNSHMDNTTGPTDMMTWTAFSGSGALWVWGQSAGPTYLQPLNDGTYSAGPNDYGYDSGTATPVSWRVHVPASTPEDQFTATLTFEVSYP